MLLGGWSSLQLQRQCLCMSRQVYHIYSTCCCWLASIHHHKQLDEASVDKLVALETAVDKMNGSWLQMLPPLYLLTDIYTMFYKGMSWGKLLRCTVLRLRCHTELHYAELTVWASAVMNQNRILHFNVQEKLDCLWTSL